MGFKDVIKKSIIEGFQTGISVPKIFITIGFAIILGVYLFFVYKYKTKSSFYSKDFNIVLVGLPVITAGIVLAMQSNLVISLGMVGALSIVRFRNAIKNSMDLLFIFWSISMGIIIGGGLFLLAFVVSFALTLILFIFDFIPVSKKSMLLVINGTKIDIENEVNDILKENNCSYKIKSRSIHGNDVDLIYEIRSKNELEIVKNCSKIKNILNINLLSHDGEERM